MIQSPCKHRFKHHAQKYTQISREKDKNNLFEKVPNAHLAYRVSVARVTVMIFFKIVTKMFFSFFQMSHFFSNISVPRVLKINYSDCSPWCNAAWIRNHDILLAIILRSPCKNCFKYHTQNTHRYHKKKTKRTYLKRSQMLI
jgi:hypothetical protein